MELTLDAQAILQQIREGKALTGKDGALAPLIKQLTEAAHQAEIESHLTQDLNRNRKILKDEIDALKEFGYNDVQILEAVAITGYFNYINTLSNVFGLGQD